MRKPNPEMLAALRRSITPEGIAEAEERRKRESEPRLPVTEFAPTLDTAAVQAAHAAFEARMQKAITETNARWDRIRAEMNARALRPGYYWVRAANAEGFYVAELIDDAHRSYGPEWYVTGSEVPIEFDDIPAGDVVARIEPPNA